MMTDKQWRDQTRRLWAKHNRAATLMMRRGIKERVKKKWMNVYIRTLHRIPDPETSIQQNTRIADTGGANAIDRREDIDNDARSTPGPGRQALG